MAVCGDFTTESIPGIFTPEPDVLLKVSKVKYQCYQFHLRRERKVFWRVYDFIKSNKHTPPTNAKILYPILV